MSTLRPRLIKAGMACLVEVILTDRNLVMDLNIPRMRKLILRRDGRTVAAGEALRAMTS